MDKTSVIFGNQIDQKTIKKAQDTKRNYIAKFGDDSEVDYYLEFEDIPVLKGINCKNIKLTKEPNENTLPKNAVVIGNIRMGFGHYRISMAMASAAKALGYEPFWFDLASQDTTGSKVIRHQNDMYSLASRISQKSRLFNKLLWEPLNRDGFKKLTYNAKDQKTSELFEVMFKHFDKETPFIATHVWPSQGAIHGGMEHVVNAIPDNWAMALHLSEGAIHAVQTPYAYLGYKIFNGFAKKPLIGLPESDLKMVGRYIDDELLVNLEKNNQNRLERINSNRPLRLLITVGGAGAGFKNFLEIFTHLQPYIEQKQIALFVNFGDHIDVMNKMIEKLEWFKHAKTFYNQYEELTKFAATLEEKDVSGLYLIYNADIFEAVYSTNLLIPESDILITKPSELAYYPIPKLYMKHIGGHEVYGAINGREIGDSVYECPDKKSITEMLDRLLNDKELLTHLINRINELHQQGYYNGSYECVKLATGKKNEKL